MPDEGHNGTGWQRDENARPPPVRRSAEKGLFPEVNAAVSEMELSCKPMKLGRFRFSELAANAGPPARALLFGRACSAARTLERRSPIRGVSRWAGQRRRASPVGFAPATSTPKSG